MADLLAPITQQIRRLIWFRFLPAVLVAGIAGILVRASVIWVAKKIAGAVNGRRELEAAVQEDLILNAPPCCPRFRRPMVKRVAKKGLKKDSGFWGCPAFPGCRGTREMA